MHKARLTGIAHLCLAVKRQLSFLRSLDVER